MKLGRLAVVATGLALAAVSVPVAAAGPAAATSAAIVTTTSIISTDRGQVSGLVTTKERKFLGIPFAKSTAGALRFHAPVPVDPWSGVRNASTASTLACPQSLPTVGTLLPSGEDCLGLDVYTPPAAASHNLPVMVWIYGGAYAFGADDYDPTPLVTRGNVIVVTLNYRVGPFGFLSLPGLDSESPAGTSGDYGLMDQQAGLKWVQSNIAAFGGNPGNVTIFGESAGGNSVCQQVASPLAAGLFQHAISESGACTGTPLATVSQATMTKRSEDYATSLGCTVPAQMVSCLRALPTSKLLSSPTVQFSSMAVTWQPSVDGYVEPRTLDQAWATGTYTHVPMLIGNNHDEGRLFVALQDHLANLSPVTGAQYVAFLKQFYGTQEPSILARYPESWLGLGDTAKASVITDGFFACPATFTTAAVTATGQHVYEYEFNDPDPPLSNLDPLMALGDYHASELWYLFDDVNGIPLLSRNAGQQQLSAQMVTAWTTFARTGAPGAVGGAAWPQWSASAPDAMSLTHLGSHVITDVAAEHQCTFWAGITPAS